MLIRSGAVGNNNIKYSVELLHRGEILIKVTNSNTNRIKQTVMFRSYYSDIDDEINRLIIGTL